MFAATLNERDFRRYAAVEALKLEHGGIKYISRLLNIVWFNGGRVKESISTLVVRRSLALLGRDLAAVHLHRSALNIKDREDHRTVQMLVAAFAEHAQGL